MNKRWFEDMEMINFFLSFQYVPGKKIDVPEEIKTSCSKSKFNLSKSELLREGKRSLERGFESAFSEYPEDVKFIVSLSAGLDSRAILGFLLKNVKNTRIITFTTGTPGTIDYEISQKVAKKAGVTNYSLDITPNKFPWTEKFLLKSAKTYERPKNLFGFHDIFQIPKSYFDKAFNKEYIFLTGFLGGELTGSRLPKNGCKTWSDAIKKFLEKNYYHPHLTTDDFDPKYILPTEPFLNKEILSYYEQLDFAIRQEYYIKPALVLNDNFKTPFISKPWLDFILNVPREYKRNQYLYKSILIELYPEIFSIGVSHNNGLPLSVNPLYKSIYNKYIRCYEKIKKTIDSDIPKLSTNKFDWNVELRRSEKFFRLVQKQLNDLEERDVVEWLNPTRLLKRHIDREDDVGREIMILTSLEIFLKIQDY